MRWCFVVVLALLWAAPAFAQVTVRDEEKGEATISNTVVTLSSMSVGDSIMVAVAGTQSSSRDYIVTSDCVGDTAAWAASSFPTYAKENGSTSNPHVILIRILATTCSGTILVTIDESVTFYGYSYSVIGFDCNTTCTDDDSDVFDNTGGADGNNTHSAPSGQIDITAQAVAVAICSMTGSAGTITKPSGFTDFTGTLGDRNMTAYKLTTGAENDVRGTFTETNQRAADCLIFAVADGAGGGGAAAPRGTLLGVLP